MPENVTPEPLPFTLQAFTTPPRRPRGSDRRSPSGLNQRVNRPATPSRPWIGRGGRGRAPAQTAEWAEVMFAMAAQGPGVPGYRLKGPEIEVHREQLEAKAMIWGRSSPTSRR
jgi:hypothetical protein